MRAPVRTPSSAGSSSPGGGGYFTAVAPIARAAATPAADEPDTNSPGERSGATGGVSLRRGAPQNTPLDGTPPPAGNKPHHVGESGRRAARRACFLGGLWASGGLLKAPPHQLQP